LALLQRAAAKNYGPALYEIAIRQIEGRDLAQDAKKGMETMRRASVLGSSQAQFYLGNGYETGSAVPRELDRARRYFRLRAVQGVPICQYRLGTLLLDAAHRPERDYVAGGGFTATRRRARHAGSEGYRVQGSGQTDASAEGLMTTLKAQLARK
jgi:TPR repeat protein